MYEGREKRPALQWLRRIIFNVTAWTDNAKPGCPCVLRSDFCGGRAISVCVIEIKAWLAIGGQTAHER